MVEIEIIIITHGRPVLLEKCLGSIEAAVKNSDPSLRLNVLIGINGPDSASLQLLNCRLKTHAAIRYETAHFANPLNPASARNRLLAMTRGEWLFFIDDDAFVGPDFFSVFLKSLGRHQRASVIGGPNLTPIHSSIFQRASGAALTSRFGSSTSCVRYKARSEQSVACGDESLILCNLFVRRSAMAAIRFPDGFVCNEENWVLQDLLSRGHLLIYEPSLYVWHERRNRPLAFARQIHKYGIGRGQNIRFRPTTLTLKHVIPALCLLFSLLAIATSKWFPMIGKIWLLCWLSYLAIWLSATARLKWNASETLQICLLGGLLFPLIHVTYGAGVLRGLTLRNE